MLEYRIRYNDDQVRNKLRNWQRMLPRFADLVVRRLGLAAVAHIQAHKLSGQVLNVRSGALRSKMRVENVRQGHVRVVAGGSDVPYAVIHETGGTIRPKRGRYLRFKTDRGWVTTREVYIPPRPYFRPGIVEFFRSGEASRIADGAFNEWQRREWGN